MGAGQTHKSRVDVACAGVFQHPRDLSVCEDASLVQDDEVVAWNNFVEQMGRPKNTDALLGDEMTDMTKDIGTRLDVEPNGRLIEQK